MVTSVKTTVGGVETTTTKTPQDAKTLWDWLNLAGVVAIPVVLAGLGAQLQDQQQKRSEEQSQVEREIADENRQEEVLQNYFDRVSALLVDKNLLAIAAKGDTATPEEKGSALMHYPLEILGYSQVLLAQKINPIQHVQYKQHG